MTDKWFDTEWEEQRKELVDIEDEEPQSLLLEDEEDLNREVCTCSFTDELPCPLHDKLLEE